METEHGAASEAPATERVGNSWISPTPPRHTRLYNVFARDKVASDEDGEFALHADSERDRPRHPEDADFALETERPRLPGAVAFTAHHHDRRDGRLEQRLHASAPSSWQTRKGQTGEARRRRATPVCLCGSKTRRRLASRAGHARKVGVLPVSHDERFGRNHFQKAVPSVPVKDCVEALGFYCDMLGFQKDYDDSVLGVKRTLFAGVSRGDSAAHRRISITSEGATGGGSGDAEHHEGQGGLDRPGARGAVESGPGGRVCTWRRPFCWHPG